MPLGIFFFWIGRGDPRQKGVRAFGVKIAAGEQLGEVVFRLAVEDELRGAVLIMTAHATVTRDLLGKHRLDGAGEVRERLGIDQRRA